jgi:hypothetical protein
MGWIKRNLLFVISGVVALLALGGAGFYIYQGWSLNSEKSTTLTQTYDTLKQLADEQPQPGNDKHDNFKLAKDQEQQIRDWVTQNAGHFQPVQPIPQGPVNSKTYATALNSTVYQLQQEAKDYNVGLPSQYYFSFQVQSTKLTISSGLEPLAKQLGEVKAIAEILFGARVNDLDSIQRVPVSDDDVGTGLQSDYTDARPITNDLAVLTPYTVTFRSFTPEFAKVISGFANSTNPFIVKSVSVQPASGADNGTGNAGAMTPMYPQQPYPGQVRPNQYGQYPPGRFPPGFYQGGVAPGQTAPNMPMPGRGGLQTVLKEQLLRVTLEVDIVNLLPKR